MRLLLVMLLLTGCAADGFTTTSGKHVGERRMAQIAPEELSLKLPPEPKVVSAQRQSLSDRILEDINFGVGIMRHETLTAGPGFEDRRSVAEFRHLFSGWFLGGITVQHGTLEPRFDHPFTYATFRLDGRNCTAFVRPLGHATGPGKHAEAVQGIFCGWSKDSTLEWAMRIESVR